MKLQNFLEDKLKHLSVPLSDFGENWEYMGQEQMIKNWKSWFKDFQKICSASSPDRFTCPIPFLFGVPGIGGLSIHFVPSDTKKQIK